MKLSTTMSTLLGSSSLFNFERYCHTLPKTVHLLTLLSKLFNNASPYTPVLFIHLILLGKHNLAGTHWMPMKGVRNIMLNDKSNSNNKRAEQAKKKKKHSPFSRNTLSWETYTTSKQTENVNLQFWKKWQWKFHRPVTAWTLSQHEPREGNLHTESCFEELIWKNSKKKRRGGWRNFHTTGSM